MPFFLLAFVSGAWLLQWQPALPGLAWAGLPLGLFAGAWLPTGGHASLKWLRRGMLAAAFLGAGFFWAAWLAQGRLADALPVAWEGRDLELSGVIASLPQERDYGVRFEFDVEEVATPGAQVPSRILLTWYHTQAADKTILAPVRAGERWRLKVRLKRPHGAANPHGFDYEAWLLERNLRATGYIRQEGPNQRLEKLAGGVAYRIHALRETIRDRFREALAGRPYAGVLIALAIGEQQAIPPDQWRVFTRTGVNHLMSISGLHVTMVASLAYLLLYWLWARSARLTLMLAARKAAAVAGAVAALGYALLAGFEVPAQRTVTMLLVVATALWLGRFSAPFHVLAIALAVVVAADPWAVLAPGFWLSFGAVAVMLYVSTGRIGQPSLAGGWWRAQWAVTLGLAPPLLVLFQQVSLVSPLANAVAIPVVSLVVVPITLLGAALPFDGLLTLAHQIMAGCMVFLAWLADLPDAVWQQHAPPPWSVAAALAGTVWMLLPRGFPARWIGVLGLLPLFLAPPPAPPPSALWLTVLDVGQGLSVVARTQTHALLYDAGPGFTLDADSGNRVIVPYLRGEGIRRLDTLVLSHDDADHHGGARSVLAALPVAQAISSLPPAHPLLAQTGAATPCHAGEGWEWDGVRFDILHPAAESYAQPKIRDNDRSCVLKISTPGASVLLTGDIERGGEAALLSRGNGALRSSVLVAPHHGGKATSGQAFVAQVAPQAVIFTVGYRNSFGHPRPEVAARYREAGAALFRSDRDGAVLVKMDAASGAQVASFRKLRRRYWFPIEGEGIE